MLPRCADSDLIDAASEVLGMMFFTDVMNGNVPSEEPEKPLTVKVEFQGASSGMLHMSMPRETAEALTANFLGLPMGEVPTEEQVNNVVNELGNMVCGSFLSKHESEELFDLSKPEILAASEPPSQVATLRRSLELDNGKMVLALSWDRLNPAA
ncbi:MAG: chemotaxis protein CheX [Acidobacteriota bacterium]|jgi:CheY-specific phosphatase CheX|nr:chemotaxis protein CheX [Bryobacteraceae bacterium CoA2 C42]